MQTLQILQNNFFVSTTRKNYVVVIFASRLTASTIIVLSRLIINIFMTFASDRNNDVLQDFCFICYKIDHFIIDCLDNSSKNVHINEIKLENLNDENSKNI